MLERGAVVGKEFTAGDVVALLDPDAVPTADAHLQTLAGRGFVRPRGDDMFGFRHVLVQEAVYRSAPKRLRAELHERYADRLDAEMPDLPDLDEFVGYHLEQAYRLRTELGESDRRTERLADDAGRRLGEAGVRASKRGDVPAAIALLRRATLVLAQGMQLRGELLCELGIALAASGESGEAVEVLQGTIDESLDSDERLNEVRARIELEYVRLSGSGATGDALLDATSQAIPVLEAAGDYRWLGRAWLLAGWVHGGRRGHHKTREKAAERALAYYKRSTWPTSTSAGEIANALYYGPKPVTEAIHRCAELLQHESANRHGRANIEVFLGGLVAQQGEFEEAKTLISAATATYEELGHRASRSMSAGAVLGDVELLEGDAIGAETTLRHLCEELERTHAYSHLASRAGDLAEALYRLGRLDESADWVAVGSRHTANDDLDARLLWLPVSAKIAARRGAVNEALAILSEAAALADTTDALNRSAAIQADTGEVLQLAGRASDASSAFRRAIELFRAKGNVVGAARVHALLRDPALA